MLHEMLKNFGNLTKYYHTFDFIYIKNLKLSKYFISKFNFFHIINLDSNRNNRNEKCRRHHYIEHAKNF